MDFFENKYAVQENQIINLKKGIIFFSFKFFYSHLFKLIESIINKKQKDNTSDSVLGMSLCIENPSIVKLKICCLPDFEEFSCTYDSNKSFEELRKDLIKYQIIKNDNFYFKVNDHVVNDDVILKDNKEISESDINIIDMNYIKIKVKLTEEKNKMRTISKYVLKSKFKVIKPDENKEVKVCDNSY